MPNQVGKIPEFTEDAAVEQSEIEETGQGQVKEAEVDETSDGKDTQSEPAADNKPATDNQREDTGAFTKEQVEQMLERATQGLRNEIVDLRRKVNNSSGTDRKIAQQELVVAEQKLDSLDDVNPEDVALIEKVLKSKGYVRQEDVSKMSYEQVKQQKINEFLEKYPEYKPENDPSDQNWNRIQQELASGFYALPKDPTKVGQLLEKIHRDTTKTTSDSATPVKKRQVEIARAGAGGVQKSSSNKSLDPHTRLMLEQGGWSKEEIDRMESKLT